MKPINFIKPINPAQHRKLLFWYRSTLALLLILVLSIASVSIKQVIDLRDLSHQKNMLLPHSTTATAQSEEPLVQEELHLKNNATAITSWLAHQKRMLDLVKNINGCLAKTHATLTSIALNNNHIELVIQCAQSLAAVQLAQLLAQTPDVAGIKLISIQPSKTSTISYRATITGRMRAS